MSQSGSKDEVHGGARPQPLWQHLVPSHEGRERAKSHPESPFLWPSRATEWSWTGWCSRVLPFRMAALASPCSTTEVHDRAGSFCADTADIWAPTLYVEWESVLFAQGTVGTGDEGVATVCVQGQARDVQVHDHATAPRASDRAWACAGMCKVNGHGTDR